MATVSILSTQITNRDASPRVRSNSRISRGPLVCSMGMVAATAADGPGSKYKLCSIPSNARVAQVLLSNVSLGGSLSTANFGLYKTTADGGAVVDEDFFGSTVALTSAQSNVDITTEANGSAVGLAKANLEKPIWEALGLSADPRIDYDVVATVVDQVISAGAVAVQVTYQL